MTDIRDNPAYEYALGTVPAHTPEDDELEQIEGELFTAAQMARMLIRHILNAAEDDACDCMMMLQRAAGLTLAEIGIRHRITKQAVHKRLTRIVKRHPEMDEYLQLKKAGRLDEHISGDVEILELRNKQHRKMKEVSTWIYGENLDKP
jgi:predicted DNA-binding protein YlxM (UPF0122 family)